MKTIYFAGLAHANFSNKYPKMLKLLNLSTLKYMDVRQAKSHTRVWFSFGPFFCIETIVVCYL